MATYYIYKNNYLSSLDHKFFTSQDYTGPDFKKYKLKMCINGQFKTVRPHIGKMTQGGFLASSDEGVIPFLTAAGEVFVTDQTNLIMTDSIEDELPWTFYFQEVSPYIIQGMIVEGNIPYGALTNADGKPLVDNYGKYLVS